MFVRIYGDDGQTREGEPFLLCKDYHKGLESIRIFVWGIGSLFVMIYNVSFIYTGSELSEAINRSVSSVAARLLDGQGNPMYESIRILKRDETEVEGHIKSAFGYLRTRLVDVCTLVEAPDKSVEVYLSLPDFSGIEDVLRSDIFRYVTTMATALWLESRHGEVAKAKYERAQEELTSIARRVKTRTRPERPS